MYNVSVECTNTRTGRPRKLGDAQVRAVLDLYYAGGSAAAVAKAAGVARRTLYNYLHRHGRGPKKKTPGDQPGACRCAYAQETTL